MSAARLAAIRARVQAKEKAEREQVSAKIAAQSQEWEEREAREREERKAALAARREAAAAAAAEAAAKEAAAAQAAGAGGGEEAGAKRRKVEEANPKCGCGVEAVSFNVVKEGPNLGRAYFTCKKGRKEQGGCNFFLWASDAAAAAVPPSAGCPKCRCGVWAVGKTVKKEGPNLGRAFHSCKRSKQFGGCDFFQWAPEAPAAEAAAGAEAPPPKTPEARGAQAASPSRLSPPAEAAAASLGKRRLEASLLSATSPGDAKGEQQGDAGP
uniref:Topoisomerase 3-alpha n=1 Tax=Lingulaulax polyedra TaxID=160621 RepID=A0A516AG59_LINPO|nr:topoisomerase 3-alpha [Lingulodinium polyedra]